MKYSDKYSYNPDFDRVSATLFRSKKAKCPPIMELWAHESFKEEYLGRPCVSADDEVEFFLGMHMDYVPYNMEWGRALARLKQRDYGKMYSFGSTDVECEFQTLEDVYGFDWPKAEDYDLTLLHDIERSMPEGMKHICVGGYIFAEAWMLMGFENFAMSVAVEPEIPAAIMNELGRFRYESFLRIIDMEKLGALWYDDDIAHSTGTMVKPDFLREHHFPWMKKIADLAKSKGIPFIYHSDGMLTDVIPDLIELGVDALQPIEPAAMDIFELMALYKDKLTFVGNMDLDTIVQGSLEDIEGMVAQRLPKLKELGYYAPGTSNTIPSWMLVEKYLFFRDCCEKYGC